MHKQDQLDRLRSQIVDLAREYALLKLESRPFEKDRDAIPASGKVLDDDDLVHLIHSSLDLWLTAGRFASRFEKNFARFMGSKYCHLVNSGSSANLIALTSLTSSKLGERALKAGDEVITVAAAFPTTVNPIVQNQLIPVFVDVDIPTYNVKVEELEAALSDRTGAVFVAHTLGNPYEVERVRRFCDEHDLWLIEDCCDAVGATYGGKMAGQFGDFATVSFYPAHHITMGEGGAVLTSNDELARIAESFRDWGRDCWCKPGATNTCGNRFGWRFDSLPEGYDHKYIYSHLGYNLKVTDMQAAIGVSQLEKLPRFIEIRKQNFQFLYGLLEDLQNHLILPKATPDSDPSWFGFPITLKDETGSARRELLIYLESRKVQTRLLFSGNIAKQPAYKEVRFRIASALANTEIILRNAFWLGIFPGLSREHLSHTADVLHQYFEVQ